MRATPTVQATLTLTHEACSLDPDPYPALQGDSQSISCMHQKGWHLNQMRRTDDGDVHVKIWTS